MKHVLNQRALFWFWKYCHFGCFGRVNKRLSNCYVLPQWKTETRTKFDSLLFTLPKQPKWSKATRHLVQDSGKNHNISTFYTVFVNACRTLLKAFILLHLVDLFWKPSFKTLESNSWWTWQNLMKLFSCHVVWNSGSCKFLYDEIWFD